MTPQQTLEAAKNALAKAIEVEQRNKTLIGSIGPAIISMLQPVMDSIVAATRFNKEDVAAAVREAVSEIKIEAPVVDVPHATVDVKMPDFNIPEIKLPEINIPEIKIPTINVPKPEITVKVPEIKIPKINLPPLEWPEGEMPIKGWVGLMGVDLQNPLPVQIRDAEGKPVNFGAFGTANVGGGASFPMQVLDVVNNALRVTGSFSVSSSTASTQAIDSSGNVYSQANPLPVTVVSGAGTSTKAQIGNSDGDYSAANPLPVSGSFSFSAAVGQGDSASALRTIQAGDSVSSVYANNPVAQGDAATALRVVVAGNSDVSVTATQTGTWNIGTVTTLTSITNSVAAALVDSGGVAYSGSNPLPTTATLSIPTGQGDAASAMRVVVAGNSDASAVITGITGPIAQGDAASALRVVIAGNSDASVTATQAGTWNIGTVTTLTGVTNSIAATILDESGAPWQPFVYGAGDAATAQRVIIAGNSDASVTATQAGTWNIGTVTTVTSITNSTATVGNLNPGTADTNEPPVKTGAVIHTTNPTKRSDGQITNFTADAVGRQTMRVTQVRELLMTAYVTLSTGSEATLLAATAGEFHDLIWCMAANTSSAAQQVDIRAVTAGNIVHTLYIPANSTAGFAPPVPWPQDATGNNWTVDMADVTNSNILITALFSKEV